MRGIEQHTGTDLVGDSADLADRATRARELAALAEAMGEVRNKSAFVVGLNEEGFEEVDGREVAIVPAWRWLAMP